MEENSGENSHELQIPDAGISYNIQPYMFEPVDDNQTEQHSSENDDSSSSEEGDEATPRPTPAQGFEAQRLCDTEWCDCGECQIMESALECVCCREFDIMDEKRADHMCITLHEGFIANCLNRDVIEVSLYEFVAYEGPLDDNVPMHETYRHVAYRRFVRWIWHRLGKYMRKVLPACVVTKIRKPFPSERYRGFRYAVPT